MLLIMIYPHLRFVLKMTLIDSSLTTDSMKYTDLDKFVWKHFCFGFDIYKIIVRTIQGRIY